MLNCKNPVFFQYPFKLQGPQKAYKKLWSLFYDKARKDVLKAMKLF